MHTHHFNNYHHHFERTTFLAYISPMEERERERESVRCRNSTNSQNSTNIFVVQSGRPIVWPITRYTPMNGETHTHCKALCAGNQTLIQFASIRKPTKNGANLSLDNFQISPQSVSRLKIARSHRKRGSRNRFARFGLYKEASLDSKV